MKGLRLLALLPLVVIAACASQAQRQEEADKLNKLVATRTELGASYLARNQVEVARQELERALALNPDDSQANNILGLLQLRLKDDAKAEQYFKHSVGEDPNNSDARNNYGVFLCERGRLDDADEQFQAALKNPLYKLPEQANTNAGICALKRSDRTAAIGYFRAALRSDPRNPIALIHLARLSLETGESLSARGFIQRYFDVARESPEALLLAFRIERALGAKDAQATYAVRLRGLFPESAEAKQLRTLIGK
jgi:type IV pilus assembly protein PilF